MNHHDRDHRAEQDHESAQRVRDLHRHLRSAATLLAEGQLDGALAEADAALALDPAATAADAIRQRIVAARDAAAGRRSVPGPSPGQTDAAPTPLASAVESPAPLPPPMLPFPTVVDARSWAGFEQKVRERRFERLLERVESLAADDAVAARTALEEARALRPEAPELTAIDARLASVPRSSARRRMVAGAGVLLVGSAALLLVPADELGPAGALVPARLYEPDPLASRAIPYAVGGLVGEALPEYPVSGMVGEALPQYTVSGMAGSASREEEADEAVSLEPPEEPEPIRASLPVPRDRPSSRPPSMPAIAPRAGSSVDARPVSLPRESVAAAVELDEPVTVLLSGRGDAVLALPPRLERPDVAAAATAVGTVGALDEQRVADVLDRYVRAYGDLDASAAREVWPSVDERALARAFSSLASQTIAFEECRIDVAGPSATAECPGRATFVGKVGSREPRTESRLWRFQLGREGEAWTIRSAEAAAP
jgi:hypothetical protein